MDADYVGEQVQIGGGFGGMKPLAQHGTVTIANGVLTLWGTKGDVIDQASLAQVEVKKNRLVAGQGINVILDGTRYFISVGHGAFQAGPIGAPALAAGASYAGTRGFIAAYESLTGRSV